MYAELDQCKAMGQAETEVKAAADSVPVDGTKSPSKTKEKDKPTEKWVGTFYLVFFAIIPCGLVIL